MRNLRCPCCGTEQPLHSAIEYCDDCNTDTCGHHYTQDDHDADREMIAKGWDQP